MNPSLPQYNRMSALLSRLRLSRGLTFGIIIIAALIAFEIFNYSTTVFALSDLMGDLQFVGIRWATILAIAFCGIDFAGIARLFTPEAGANEPTEVWYLFAAWLLAATMNAMLTWWGVSIAILNHQSLGNAVISHDILLRAVPVFVAIMVWLIRVLIIGTFSVAGDRLFSQAERNMGSYHKPGVTMRALGASTASPPARIQAPANTFRPAAKPSSLRDVANPHPEPTYHPLMSAKPPQTGNPRMKS